MNTWLTLDTLIPWALFYIPLAIALGSCVYHLAIVIAALRFHREPEPATDYQPPVSVLKPIRGIEPDFYATLRTYFQQDYSDFEIIFGLGDDLDPAHWTIRQLQKEFPAIPLKVLLIPDLADANPKTNKLERMMEEAGHEILVISDADIRVTENYLREVVRPLADDRVGLVSCLYRGVPSPSLSSVLEALNMSTDFAGQVLLGRWLGGMRFGLGATLATRKKQIREIGGFRPWVRYLADDFICGRKISEAGYRVHLSHTVVETLLPRRTLAESLQQQLRWARTIRSCSPAGYVGLLVAFGVPIAFIPVLCRPESVAALSVLAGVLVLRTLAAWTTGRLICRDPLVNQKLWLLPLRDLLALVVWILSFFSRNVVWRNRRFRIEAGGRIRST